MTLHRQLMFQPFILCLDTLEHMFEASDVIGLPAVLSDSCHGVSGTVREAKIGQATYLLLISPTWKPWNPVPAA
jgi:hypothetical protein